MKSDFTVLEMCLVNEEEERENERYLLTTIEGERKRISLLDIYAEI